MAKLGGFFDSSQHEGMADFTPVPAGKYCAQIVGSDYVQNSKKNGHILKVTFEITQGEQTGKKIFVNLNLDNPSGQAVEIAKKELATITRACNKKVITDSVQLHNIPVLINVSIAPAKGDYPARNKITNYEAFNPASPEGAKSSNTPPPWVKAEAF